MNKVRQREARGAIAIALLVAAAVAAAAPVVYPAKGQSASKQKSDEGACYSWARSSTGIDPVAASQPVPQETGPATGGGERVRGAGRGALGGAVIGGIAGDAGQGAAIGAVVGTMAGGRRARQNQDARNQQAQNAQAQTMDTYYRAYAACMESRGYTVR
jgi:hypothetical protein